MGQHKHNPVAIAAKNGELPPKKSKMSKRKMEVQMEALVRKKLQDATGLPQLVREMGAEYFYM